MELTGVQIGIIMLALAVTLMFLGFPVAVTMLIAGFLGVTLIRGLGPALSNFATVPWRQSLKEILVIIPLFTWMGVMAARGGISTDAFTSLYKWVGHLRGGLAMAVSAASAAFGAVCGNHIATAVTMTKIALPEMRKYKYKDSFSLGTIASSGNLGIMIPPSGAFILFGFLTMTSIGELFIAGILPGIFVLALFWIQIALQTRLNPNLAPAGPSIGWNERLKSLPLAIPILVAFIVVIGGIYSGVFTPTEGACWGCFVMLVIGVVRRRLSFKGFIQSLQETMPVAAMIMLMLVSAWVFSSALTLSGLPQAITNAIVGLGINRYLILSLMVVVFLLLGCVMDIYAVLIITLPIFFPIVGELGFSSVHFGVLCVMAIMAGSISPPFGILVYALHGMNRDVPMFSIFRGVMPFFVTLVIATFILIFVPQIALVLPNLAFAGR